MQFMDTVGDINRDSNMKSGDTANVINYDSNNKTIRWNQDLGDARTSPIYINPATHSSSVDIDQVLRLDLQNTLDKRGEGTSVGTSKGSSRIASSYLRPKYTPKTKHVYKHSRKRIELYRKMFARRGRKRSALFKSGRQLILGKNPNQCRFCVDKKKTRSMKQEEESCCTCTTDDKLHRINNRIKIQKKVQMATLILAKLDRRQQNLHQPHASFLGHVLYTTWMTYIMIVTIFSIACGVAFHLFSTYLVYWKISMSMSPDDFPTYNMFIRFEHPPPTVDISGLISTPIIIFSGVHVLYLFNTIFLLFRERIRWDWTYAVCGAVMFFLICIELIISSLIKLNHRTFTAERKFHQLEKTLVNRYTINGTDPLSVSMDLLSVAFKCCGLKSRFDFEKHPSIVYEGRTYRGYPASCCKNAMFASGPNYVLHCLNSGIDTHEEGCYQAVKNFMLELDLPYTFICIFAHMFDFFILNRKYKQFLIKKAKVNKLELQLERMNSSIVIMVHQFTGKAPKVITETPVERKLSFGLSTLSSKRSLPNRYGMPLRNVRQSFSGSSTTSFSSSSSQRSQSSFELEPSISSIPQLNFRRSAITSLTKGNTNPRPSKPKSQKIKIRKTAPKRQNFRYANRNVLRRNSQPQPKTRENSRKTSLRLTESGSSGSSRYSTEVAGASDYSASPHETSGIQSLTSKWKNNRFVNDIKGKLHVKK